MTREANCKRCGCQFTYEATIKAGRMSWRSICDPCVPLQKAAHSAAHVQKLKRVMAQNRSGMGATSQTRDPFQRLTIRGYASVARILGCSLECVRVAEARGLAKARKLFTYEQFITLFNHGRA